MYLAQVAGDRFFDERADLDFGPKGPRSCGVGTRATCATRDPAAAVPATFHEHTGERMIATPQRDARHEALSVFLGRWTARGTSYGGTDQTGGDPRANGEAWVSTHEATWHTGGFFLVHDERADIAGRRFDTLGVMGVGDDGAYFSRGFENHGYYRDYQVTRDGDTWRFEGPTERATITFEAGGRRQAVTWEWKPAGPAGAWLPLCDRTAERVAVSEFVAGPVRPDG